MKFDSILGENIDISNIFINANKAAADFLIGL